MGLFVTLLSHLLYVELPRDDDYYFWFNGFLKSQILIIQFTNTKDNFRVIVCDFYLIVFFVLFPRNLDDGLDTPLKA